ncbi:MAG TPA: oligosaccharide flippase family protein [Terriglobia bacterium]|nr:oligosaccharide flippase family protein [Terriglobia bacterium]
MDQTEQKSDLTQNFQAKAIFGDTKSRIPRSLFSNWAGMGANVVVGFLLAPFIVHRLGNTSYGIWALVIQLTGYMGVFDVGVRSALVRFVARFRAAGDQGSMNRLLSMTLTMYSGLATVTIAVGLALATLALPHMQIPLSMRWDSQVVLMLTAITLAAGFPLGLFQAVLSGLSRWDLTNAVNISTLLLRTALIVIFLLNGHGLIALGIINLLTTLMGYGSCGILVFKLMPNTKISLFKWDQTFFRPVFAHSFYSFLIGIGNRINYGVDTIVIAAFLPVQAVTFYVIGFKLVQYLRDLVNASSVIIAPIVSGLEAQQRTDEIQAMLVQGCKFLLLASYPVIAGLLILGPDFIQVWMGNGYKETSGKVLMILACGQFVSFTEHIPAHILFGLSQHKINAWCTILEAVLNLGLSIALVQSFGIYGVALSTTIGIVIVRGWIFPRGYLRTLGISWFPYFRSAIFPPLASTLVFCAGVLGFRQFLVCQSFLMIGAAVACGLVLYVPFVLIFVLNQTERLMARRFIPWNRLKQEIAG